MAMDYATGLGRQLSAASPALGLAARLGPGQQLPAETWTFSGNSTCSTRTGRHSVARP